MAGPYGRLRALVPSLHSSRGLTIGNLAPPGALAALLRQGLTADTPAAAPIDLLLLRACVEPDADADESLCLRCRASHPIERELLSLQSRWGASHHLDPLDMASRVLDDDGRPLPWAPPSTEDLPRHVPFSLRVLREWRPEVAHLDRWCRVRVQSDPALRQLLLSHGLLLLGPWALLASASRIRVERAWHAYGQGALTAAAATDLHAAYLPLYREAKDAHRRQWKRSRGWVPTRDFLESLRPGLPPADTLHQLQAIAAALRRFWLEGPPLEVPRDSAPPLAHEESPDDELAALAALIDPALRRACQRHHATLFSGADQDAALRRCLWSAFADGLNQRASAERCGCSQPMVSRRLQLQRHANAIATTAALELGRHPAFARRFSSVADRERLVAALVSHLLAPPPNESRPRLAGWLRPAPPAAEP